MWRWFGWAGTGFVVDPNDVVCCLFGTFLRHIHCICRVVFGLSKIRDGAHDVGMFWDAL